MSNGIALTRAVGLLAVLWAGVACAQSAVTIEKATNGMDADVAPGPGLIVGTTVNWTYLVRNTGARPLQNIVVTDDQGVVVSCPSTDLDPGLTMTCTGSGIVVAGQYSNLGTVNAEDPMSAPVSDSDSSHYFGQAAAALTLVKSVNGLDANSPPGPAVPIGSTANWTYEVTNVSGGDVINIVVSDDQGVSVSCPGSTLTAGASMTCTGSGSAQPGQYVNMGTVVGELPDMSISVASDPAYYFGQSVLIEAATNAVDADTAPGPVLQPGDVVSWTYSVENPGPETITNVMVTDDQGVTVSCPATTLVSGENMVCTASGVVVAGQYSNLATVTADLPLGGQITDSDPSHYYGNAIGIQSLTNGVDADTAPGPSILSGSAITWTYTVTNFGSDDITSIAVNDDQAGPATCPMTTLVSGASMDCTINGIAAVGAYTNIGSATGDIAPIDEPPFSVDASDPSNYFGVALDYGDAPDPSYPTLQASNGASHGLQGPYLGACADGELDGLQSAGVDGDDLDGGVQSVGTCVTAGNDDDGVTFTTMLRAGDPASVDVTASAACTLSAFIDFNADGDWSDAGEDLFPGGQPLAAGVNSLGYGVPLGAVAGATAARFRCTTDGAVSFSGAASDGEVEDYAVDVLPALPAVTATKTDILLVDADSDGLFGSGDTVRYTIEIANSGNGSADSVVLTDTPDANTTLVVGSVTTSQGTVTSGNGSGDTSVAVDLGSIAGSGGSVTITFDVTVNLLPVGVAQLSNQGSVVGGNFVTLATDDPDTGVVADATITPLANAPLLQASKSDALLVDADSDSLVGAGDTLAYTVVITNIGTGNADGVTFVDTPGSNSTLVSGSVATTQGTATQGNGGADSSVGVDIGNIAGGGSVTVTFQVTVDPLPSGVIQLTNQGSVSGTNVTSQLTDDPDLGGASDPTLTMLGNAPSLQLTKQVSISIDVNQNGLADRGDTLEYSLSVSNSGVGTASAVVVDDSLSAYTDLVVGSVTTSQGSVTLGNAGADSSVSVAVGDLLAGASATVGFSAVIRLDTPPLISTIDNQAQAGAGNAASMASDDPGRPGAVDPTSIALANAPAAIATPEMIPAVGKPLQLLMLAALLLIVGVALRDTRRG